MKKAREAYGLSMNDMSRVCGFGKNGWTLYETGKAKPNKSHALLIMTATQPFGMWQLLRLCSDVTVREMGQRWAKAHSVVFEMNRKIDRQAEGVKVKLNKNYFG